jgi:hypothetical protein
MSLQLEMLQAARLAPRLLGESTGLVRDFLLRQQNADGGFKDRTGKSDLYYTAFGLAGLAALGDGLQSTVHGPQSTVHSSQFLDVAVRAGRFLCSFEDGLGLDFVHVCCLARCWAAVLSADSGALGRATAQRILGRVEDYRSADGGYHPAAGSKFGTAYGAFLGLGAYQDMKGDLPEPLRLVESLKALQTPDGAWTNERAPQLPGATNATAAAVAVLRHLGVPVRPSVGGWLLARSCAQGGFLAAPTAPMPDLLSTATALHALAGLRVPLDGVKEQSLDFIDTLWTNEGGFYGHWGDDHLDCEYTFYGLLALGHLSR